MMLLGTYKKFLEKPSIVVITMFQMEHRMFKDMSLAVKFAFILLNLLELHAAKLLAASS